VQRSWSAEMARDAVYPVKPESLFESLERRGIEDFISGSMYQVGVSSLVTNVFLGIEKKLR